MPSNNNAKKQVAVSPGGGIPSLAALAEQERELFELLSSHVRVLT